MPIPAQSVALKECQARRKDRRSQEERMKARDRAACGNPTGMKMTMERTLRYIAFSALCLDNLQRAFFLALPLETLPWG